MFRFNFNLTPEQPAIDISKYGSVETCLQVHSLRDELTGFRLYRKHKENNKIFEEFGVLNSSMCIRRQHLSMICYYGFLSIKISTTAAGIFTEWKGNRFLLLSRVFMSLCQDLAMKK